MGGNVPRRTERIPAGQDPAAKSWSISSSTRRKPSKRLVSKLLNRLPNIAAPPFLAWLPAQKIGAAKKSSRADAQYASRMPERSGQKKKATRLRQGRGGTGQGS